METQHTWQVTSANRTQAKRILNTWHDSRNVRMWSLAELNTALRNAVNRGLITDAGIARALRNAKQTELTQQRGGTGETERTEDAVQAQTGDDDAQGEEQGEAQAQTQTQGEDDADGEQGDEQEQGEDEDEATGEVEDEAQAETEDDEDEDEVCEHPELDKVVRILRAGLHVALVGPAGSGKSTLAKHAAEKLGRPFFAHGSLFSKFELTGFKDGHGQYQPSIAYEALTQGGVHCFDEYDGSVPEAGVAFNSLIDHQTHVHFPCGMVEKHPDYIAVATMNTWGQGATADYVGRFKLDAANADRWVFVYIDYNAKLEKRLAGKDNHDLVERAQSIRAACNALGLRHIVSTRKIVQARRMREAGFSNRDIDKLVFFARLDDETVKQLAAQMRAGGAA